MKKYLAGGKAVGGTSSSSSPAMAAEQNASFASLLAQREAQDAMWREPAAKPISSFKEQQQIVVVQQKKSVNTKGADIDLILGGDYD